MLKLSDSLVNIEVMSLRTGGSVGTATAFILNPNNLKVEGWYVMDKFSKNRLVLVSSEVRDLLPQGIAVNDHEVLIEAEDLVRLKPIMDMDFKLIGKNVVSQNGKKYGKVNDFAIEDSSLLVKKIYASQKLIKNLSGGSRSIDRTQIIEITNTSIIIEDPTETSRAPARATAAVSN